MTARASNAKMAHRPGRYCDQPTDWRARLAGFTGTATIAVLCLVLCLVSWRVVQSPARTVDKALTVMELGPLAAPPAPPKEVPPGPEQVEAQAANSPPEPVVEPQDLIEPLISLSTLPAPPAELKRQVERVDPGVPVPQTSAPRSVAAPSVNSLSNDARPEWEALVLAHLERFRRYPSRARSARQQGAAYVRFTMNRAGIVLASSIVKKSGSIDLDRAALDTLRRAQPLPAIPADRPDKVELTMPVEFNLH